MSEIKYEIIKQISVPPPFALRARFAVPQMQAYAEFGGGEYKVEMNIFIYAQVEVVLPPFSPRCSSRGANGGR